jgi:ribose transport system ATP-binding protein
MQGSIMAASPIDMADRGAGPLLAVRRLSKRFGGTQALQAVDITVNRGEIHALLGANGAGKSTVIKILAGIHAPDSGEIALNGIPVGEITARNSMSFVHQDLGLIETMTVGENMAMGYGYPMRWRFIDWPSVQAAAKKALDFLDTSLPLDRPVAELSRAEKSIVAIARALVGKVDLLVLDEPTASLPEADVGRLFGILDRLRQHGVGIVYVSHRLDEVFRIADAVTVLRDGRTVAAHRPLQISPDELVTEIVGSVPPPHLAAPKPKTGTPAIELRELRSGHVGPVSFQVAAGEIVGLAGLRGQGHEVVGRAIAGVLPHESGTILIGGHPTRIRTPAEAIGVGLGFATGKRAEEALASTMTVKENLFLNPVNFGHRPFGLNSRRKEREAAAAILRHFDVRPPEGERDIDTLSGGNQQKVVLARWAGQRYRLLVLEDPTIGVDVGAKAQIYRMLTEDAAAGTAAIVVSSDLDEMVQICDRVLAFSRGRVVAELAGGELSVEALTAAVGGVRTEPLPRAVAQ